MTVRQEFEDDPLTFLSRNAVGIKAAGSALDELANYGDFSGWKMNTSKASLTAPSGYAQLSQIHNRKEHDYIKCSVSEFELSLVPTTTEIPVYVVPYKGTAAAGVKLPAGPGRAYCITTRIDGCTFTVSGEPQSPYAGHSNAYIKGGSEAEKMEKMRDHVLMLEREFIKSELLDGGDIRTVGENRTHFNYWHQPQLGRPASFVNYAEAAQQRVALEAASGVHHYRETATIGHRKYHIKLSDQSQAHIMGQHFIPKNAVIGVREAGTWSFYTNSYWDIEFDIVAERKVGSVVTNSTPTKFKCTAVLTYGRLWPDPVMHYRPFLTSVGERPK